MTFEQLRQISQLVGEILKKMTQEKGSSLDPQATIAALKRIKQGTVEPAEEPVSFRLDDAHDVATSRAIVRALQEADGSREKASELLGIAPTTCWRMMTRLGITFEQ